MPVYYAMRYLSGVLCSVTTIKEHPHTKTPNAGGEPRPRAAATQERRLLGVGSSAWLCGPRGTTASKLPGKTDAP
jgi:hypothetical protein